LPMDKSQESGSAMVSDSDRDLDSDRV